MVARVRSLTRSLRSWTRPAVLVTCNRFRWMTGQAGRVVAAVLQAPQTLEQHRDRVPAADVPHDSAHFGLPSVRLALSVDDAPELALRQCGRREPALPELGRDQRPDLIVLALASLQFGVAPADELLDRLVEVRRYVGDDPDRGGLRQARRGRQVAREILRERDPPELSAGSGGSGVGMPTSYSRRRFRQDFCPIPGKNCLKSVAIAPPTVDGPERRAMLGRGEPSHGQWTGSSRRRRLARLRAAWRNSEKAEGS